MKPFWTYDRIPEIEMLDQGEQRRLRMIGFTRSLRKPAVIIAMLACGALGGAAALAVSDSSWALGIGAGLGGLLGATVFIQVTMPHAIRLTVEAMDRS